MSWKSAQHQANGVVAHDAAITDWRRIDAIFDEPHRNLSALAFAAGHHPDKFFVGRDFRGLSLKNIDISSVCLDRANLQGTQLRYAILNATTSLIGAKLDAVDRRALTARGILKSPSIPIYPNNMTPEEMKFRNISYILKGHTQRVNAVTVVKADVVLIPDPNFRVVSGSQDKTIRIWDGISGECTSVLTGHTASVTTLSCLDSARFVSGSKDRTLRIWDIRSEKCLKILKGHTSSIHTISTTDDYIFSGSADKTIRCWSARTGECLSVLHGHTDPIKSIAVIDHRRIVSGSYDGSLRLWDVATGTCLGLIENSGGLIANKSKGEIVSIRSGDVFNIIDVDSGDIIHTLKNNLSPDVRDIVRFGNTVLICHYDGTIGFLSKDGESYRKSVSFTKGLLSMSMQELGWFGAYGDVFGNVIVFEYLRNERVTRAWPIDTFEILDS